VSPATPWRPSGGWRPALLLVAASGLGALVPLRSSELSRPLALDVQSIALNPEDPARLTVGPLRFRGGLWLRSADPRFGGLSDLRVCEDGRRLLAVSDCGRGFVARLDYDAQGDLAGLRSAKLIELLGPGGLALPHREIDAEGLTVDDGGLLVAFEGEVPRLWRYPLNPPFAGRPVPQPAPPFGDDCRSNRGPELLASLGDGQLLVACEGEGSSTALWVGAEGHWMRHTYPLVREEGGDSFHPTAATRDPEGGVLLLERRYPPLGVRLVHLSEGELEGEAPLEPREVARLQAPLTVDNFEGLDARRDIGGVTLLYLLSDDNGCAKRPGAVSPRQQRTLLLLFERRKVLGSPP
jgi:hypothetical protein